MLRQNCIFGCVCVSLEMRLTHFLYPSTSSDLRDEKNNGSRQSVGLLITIDVSLILKRCLPRVDDVEGNMIFYFIYQLFSEKHLLVACLSESHLK